MNDGRVWIVCEKHDVRYLTRSAASLEHSDCPTHVDEDQHSARGRGGD